MTLAEKVGQLFMTYGYGPTADTVDRATRPSSASTRRPAGAEYHLGGVIYFGVVDNVQTPRNRRPVNGSEAAIGSARTSRC